MVRLELFTQDKSTQKVAYFATKEDAREVGDDYINRGMVTGMCIEELEFDKLQDLEDFMARTMRTCPPEKYPVASQARIFMTQLALSTSADYEDLAITWVGFMTNGNLDLSDFIF